MQCLPRDATSLEATFDMLQNIHHHHIIMHVYLDHIDDGRLLRGDWRTMMRRPPSSSIETPNQSFVFFLLRLVAFVLRG